ncbi:MAG: hypothetical protein KDC98_02005, partial [Planctomycetes bacterium]|nr:hypothetical protein [Planctomycetota bacterium]
MHPCLLRGLPAVLLLVAACDTGPKERQPAPTRFVLSVNGDSVAPSPDLVAPALSYRPQIGVASFGSKFRLTTPADEPFAFDLVAWNDGASGATSVSIKHVGDGGREPGDSPVSLARAGIAPAGTGLWQREGWLTVSGDGFARLTLQGRIDREQVFAVSDELGGMSLVVLAIGERSAINQADPLAPAHPAVTSRATIYSSDAWAFGLPTIAVSGDRSTIVAYEGDRDLAMMQGRYELRMQHDAATGAVTGGGTVESGNDSGNWRDHEIAALYNVLAV